MQKQYILLNIKQIKQLNFVAFLFYCGSWRIFVVAVGAFSLWQLANISYNCQYLHNTTIDGAKLQNRLYRIMVIVITKKTPKNQD